MLIRPLTTHHIFLAHPRRQTGVLERGGEKGSVRVCCVSVRALVCVCAKGRGRREREGGGVKQSAQARGREARDKSERAKIELLVSFYVLLETKLSNVICKCLTMNVIP